MVTTPQAVWLVGGTPSEVEKSVKKVMKAAALVNRVPVLVAYNLPFRDCALYSAGGAVDAAAYQAWIAALAKGIGGNKAVVILEPDGLGIIPYNTTIYGASEWCQPTVAAAGGSLVPAPGASPEVRYSLLQYAGVTLKSAAPNFATNPAEGGWRLGNFGWCASQYNPAADYALDYSPDYAASVTAQIQDMMGSAVATLPFVVDTARNGRGPLSSVRYGEAPYNQPASVLSKLKDGGWCNPVGAGLGVRPTAATGVPLVDAYLWLKKPGESDGSCDIAGGARAWDYEQYNPWGLSDPEEQSHFDPLWGFVDPIAGEWFPEQALELARNASPPLF